MKRIRKVLAWWLCAMVFVGTVACSGEKSASGKKSPDIETQQEKPPVSDGKNREKSGSPPDCTSDKVVLENNALGSVLAAANKQKPGTTENWQEQQQAAIREACSGGTPVSCETAVAAVGSAIAWPLLPAAAATTSIIGAGANAGVGWLINGEVNPNDVILGYWTGALTAGTGLWGTMGINAISGGTSSYLKGDDPLK